MVSRLSQLNVVGMRRFVISCVLLLSSSSALGLCIKAKMAHLRKGPGTKYSKSWTVGRHTPFEKVKRKGGWLQVRDVDDELHWIHGSLITYKYSCLTVSVPVGFLRSGPGRKHKLVSMRQADRYTSFKKLDREGHWFKIESARGEVAWIHDSNVWRPLKAISISF